MSSDFKKSPTVLDSLKKPDLILVHGFRGSPLGLAEIADLLRANGYCVHVPAIPPFGGAPALDSYTPQHYADYLANYIRSQSLTRPVLIGHSMGSVVTSATLNYYPELVSSKAILMSPISQRTAPPFRLIAPLSALLPARSVDYITTKYLTTIHDRTGLQPILDITHRCGIDHSPRRREVLKASLFSTHYCITDFNLHQEVLLLAGEHDHLVPQKQTIQAGQKLRAEVQFLPGTGHIHNYEQPQATVEAIIKFLEN